MRLGLRVPHLGQAKQSVKIAVNGTVALAAPHCKFSGIVTMIRDDKAFNARLQSLRAS